MASVIDRLNGVTNGLAEVVDDDKKRASKARMCLRFRPLPDNEHFNGRFISPNYSMLVEVEGKLDWTEVTILYADGRRFIITGTNLRGLADAAESGALKEVVQLDALHAANPDGTEYAVTGIAIVMPERTE